MTIVGMPCVLLPPLDVQNKHGHTAAMEAADEGHVDCLTALIEGKADLDIKVRGVMTHGRVALLVGPIDVCVPHSRKCDRVASRNEIKWRCVE